MKNGTELTPADFESGRAKPLFFHFRLPGSRATVKYQSRGGATACFNPVMLPGPEIYYRCGIAICSPLDVFRKKRGRKIALAKTRDPKSAKVSVKADLPVMALDEVRTVWLTLQARHRVKSQGIQRRILQDPRLLSHTCWEGPLLVLARRPAKAVKAKTPGLRDWAKAIARRVADESSFVDKEALYKVLSAALPRREFVAKLVGTDIIEEDYFETLGLHRDSEDPKAARPAEASAPAVETA